MRFTKEQVDRMDVADKMQYINREVEKKKEEFSSKSTSYMLNYLVKYLESIGIVIPVLPSIHYVGDKSYVELRILFDRVSFSFGYCKSDSSATVVAMFNAICRYELGLDFKHDGLLFCDRGFEDDPKPAVTILDMLDNKDCWFNTLNKSIFKR